MRLVVLLPIVTSIIFFLSCHSNSNGPETPAAILSPDYVGVTEASIRIQIASNLTHGGIELRRNDSTILSVPYRGTDTLILDQGLLPARSYTYRLLLAMPPTSPCSDASLTILTMDSTSHAFKWTLDTLGDGASSMLTDVCIINDTCIWAVGEMDFKDTNGQWQERPYNLAEWNGRRWQLESIDFVHDYGTGYSKALAVYAFSPNDIVVYGSGSVMHWNGRSWNLLGYLCHGVNCIGNILKIWGRSSNDFYGVGLNGSIVHWNGASWQRIESGTTLDIQDVWGTQDRGGQWEILAVAGNYLKSNERKILKIDGLTVTPLSDSPINWGLVGVWFVSNSHYYVVGDGIYERHSLRSGRWMNAPNEFTTFTTNAVRGTGLNNVFVAGAYGEMLHFNGISWHSYMNQTRIDAGQYYDLACNGRMVVAVGQEYPRAIVARGIPLERR